MNDITKHKFSDPFVSKAFVDESCFQIHLIDGGHVEIDRNDAIAIAKHFGIYIEPCYAPGYIPQSETTYKRDNQ